MTSLPSELPSAPDNNLSLALIVRPDSPSEPSPMAPMPSSIGSSSLPSSSAVTTAVSTTHPSSTQPSPATLGEVRDISGTAHVVTLIGDPLEGLSQKNRQLIQSHSGNASLGESRLICLSDHHSEMAEQTIIRAAIINEIMMEKVRTSQFHPTSVLVEGEPHGPIVRNHPMFDESTPVPYGSTVSGWDDAAINTKCMTMARRAALLEDRALKLDKEIQQKPPLAIFESDTAFEAYDVAIKDKKKEKKACEEESSHLFEQISKMSVIRNKALYKAIFSELGHSPSRDVLAIGGGRHFDEIATVMSAVPHRVIQLGGKALSREEANIHLKNLYIGPYDAGRKGPYDAGDRKMQADNSPASPSSHPASSVSARSTAMGPASSIPFIGKASTTASASYVSGLTIEKVGDGRSSPIPSPEMPRSSFQPLHLLDESPQMTPRPLARSSMGPSSIVDVPSEATPLLGSHAIHIHRVGEERSDLQCKRMMCVVVIIAAIVIVGGFSVLK